MESIIVKIQTSLIIYLFLILISYKTYSLLREKIPNKVKHYVVSRSFIFLIATLIGAFFLSDPNWKQPLFTFSAVYLGFWLKEQVASQEERRKLKFFLDMVWQELRYNKVMLETIKQNYVFFMDKEENLEIMFLKFSGINTHAGFLKSTIYDALVSSSVITGLKKDELFNDLTTAYTNMKFLQSALGIVLTDFEIKLRVHRYAVQKNGKDENIKQILEDLSKKIKNNAGKELAISYRSVCKAIDNVNEYLSTMMVKAEEDKKADADLTKEDKESLNNILRKSPDKLPKDLFAEQG